MTWAKVLPFLFIHSHPFPVVALHHTQVFPAVTLVKGRVLRDKVECADTFRRHILADMRQEVSGNTEAAAFRLDVQGTDVRCQVFAVVEVVGYHTGSADNPPFIGRYVPLRNGRGSVNALIYAYQVFLQRNFPFLLKPACRWNAPFRAGME